MAQPNWRIVVLDVNALDADTLAAVEAATIRKRTVKPSVLVALLDDEGQRDLLRGNTDAIELSAAARLIENPSLARGDDSIGGLEWNYELRRTATLHQDAVKIGWDGLRAKPTATAPAVAPPRPDAPERGSEA